MWFRRTPEKILEQSNPQFVINDLVQRIERGQRFDELTRAEQVLVLIDRLRKETLNGTVEQYLANSSGDLFADTVNALREINATESHTILLEIAAWFPDGGPARDRATRGQQIEQLRGSEPEEFEARVRRTTDKLVDTFPAMLKALVSYLRDHSSEIR